MQAIYRTIHFQISYTPDEVTLTSTLGLIGMLNAIITPGAPETPHPPDYLASRGPEKLGFPRGMSGNEAFTRIFAPNDYFNVDVGVGPGGDFCQASIRSQSLQSLAARTATNPDLIPWLASWRFFETEVGCVGAGPDMVQPGDRLCVLAGSGVPVLLRESEDGFLHVGQCFVLGLMEGRLPSWSRLGNVK